ncbi:thymidine phosphorylase [Marinomonas sp. MED121]|uniref:hypothetical protein n=1 Tax=Marinomonas sp. MED121 TaxID=314277 RepID=UPI000068FE21|nr:hypothetical protein [Marinomonas sp. MED121]EAQ63418.1 thymidine phosphorylase [Marinomonas sp. MED121]
MAKNIIFLNMSDDLGVDGHKAVTALKLKHPNSKYLRKSRVTEIDIVSFYRAFINGPQDAAFNRQRNDLKNKCKGATEVMLSIHGPMTSTDYGLIRATNPVNPDERVTVRQLAELLLMLFIPKVNYNFTLVMCFGARSSQYRLDHQNLDLIDWTDSFAYKLFDSISPRRQVRLTARTGELSFNTVTGKSEVQTELAIQGTLDNQRIGQEAAVINSLAWWGQNLGRMMRIAGPKQNFIISLETAKNNPSPATVLTQLRALNTNPGLSILDPDRQALVEYLGHTIRLTEASSRQSDPVQGKYGKLVYSNVPPLGNIVIAKYPNPMMVHPKYNGHVSVIPNDFLQKLAK